MANTKGKAQPTPANEFRPYETPWLWPDSVPNVGDTVKVGSDQTAKVIKVTGQYIYLDNKRSFRR